MSSNSDLNLLLGILALQMNFISREQLLEATNTWVNDKTRRLDEVLLEQESLQSETQPLLVTLVEKHLELHNDDPEQSLAAVSSLGSMRDELNELGDAEITATIMHTRAEHKQVGSTATETPHRSPSVSDRFRILRPHARGGLGEVFVAQDTELNREVALKEIQDRHADNPDSRSRFVLEAEVTGGLEHPGIVPVYGLGQYADGRPYYAMRFILGESLKEAVSRFHRTNRGDRRNIGFDSMEFRKLLGRLVDVCNAIQYAHDRGVLHRDLKPSNIMLGKYGETLVVDWGLAKVQGNKETVAEGEPALQPNSLSGSTATQFGSALGTPAYMPPEQAAGRLEELGPESDVYSLGATLYHLLTGQTPFGGDDVAQILKSVEAGDFPAPRQIQSDVPRPLETICLRAMATRKRDRYATPLELADDVERFLADERVSVHQESLVARGRRWVRKHQTFAASTAAVVLVSTLGLASFSTVVSGKNVQLAAKNQQLTAANRRALDAQMNAEENEQAARQQSQLALATLTSVISDIQAGLQNLPGSGNIRRRLLKTSLTKLENVSTEFVEQAKVDQETIQALWEIGHVVLNFSSNAKDSGEQAVDEELESSTRLATTFFERAHQIALQRANDDPQGAPARRDLSDSYANIGDVQLRSGKSDLALSSYQQALRLLKDLTDEHPDDVDAQRRLSSAYTNIGDVRCQLGESEQALEPYELALQINEMLAEDDPEGASIQRNLSIDYNRIGDVHLDTGNSDLALASYRKALQLREKLAKDDPDNVDAQRDLSISCTRLGDAQVQSGDSNAALAMYEKALQICKKLAKDDPNNTLVKRDLSISFDNIGSVQLGMGRAELASASFRNALQIDEELAALDPDSAQAQNDLSNGYTRVGDVHIEVGELEQALTYFQKALIVREKLAELDPGNVQARRELSYAYDTIGNAQNDLGDSESALLAFQKALQIDTKLLEDDPESAEARANLSYAHSRVGDVHLDRGENELALASYHNALQIDKKLAQETPEDSESKQDLANAYRKIGDAHVARADYGTAVTTYETAASILREMIDKGMDVESSKIDLASVEEAAAAAKRKQIPMDD